MSKINVIGVDLAKNVIQLRFWKGCGGLPSMAGILAMNLMITFKFIQTNTLLARILG